MADAKISELPVATAIASPDVAPIVQGGVTKQANVGLFAGLSGSIADQQVAFGSGTTIAGSDSFKWIEADGSLEVNSTLGNFPVADQGDIRVPKAFTIVARNNADDDNFTILNKKVTSGHDDLVIGDLVAGAALTFNGIGNSTTLQAGADGEIFLRAAGGSIAMVTDPLQGFDTESQGDFEISGNGWLALGSQTRAELLAAHGGGNPPFESVIYEDSTDHHFYGYNGTAFVQLDNKNIVFPDSDPHVVGAGYWSGGVLTRSNG